MFFWQSLILCDNSLPLSCDHKKENTGYMGLWVLWADKFGIVYGLEENESFCKAYLIRYKSTKVSFTSFFFP